MARMIAPLFVIAATPALAHPGFHPNPHGVEYGWLAVAAVGALAAFVWQRVKK